MIQTRGTIFKTLKKRIRELTKHAQLAPEQFRKIMLAVILNDLKEWSEYIPNKDSDKIVKLLEEFLLTNCFIIDRIPINESAYINVNTPQTNNTWHRVWDKGCSSISLPELIIESAKPWTPDPTCEIKFVYFVSIDSEGRPITNREYLSLTYGEHGEKLKTICEKMNIFIDRETGSAWYLDNSTCEWKPVRAQSESGMTQEQVEALLTHYKINNQWNEAGNEIQLSLVKDTETYDNTLDVITANDVEDMV